MSLRPSRCSRLRRRARAETARAEVERLRLGAGRPIDDRGVDDACAGLALPRLARRAERMHATFNAPGDFRLGAARRQHGGERDFVTGDRSLPCAAALPLAFGAHASSADDEAEVVELRTVARRQHLRRLRSLELLIRCAGRQLLGGHSRVPHFLVVAARDFHHGVRRMQLRLRREARDIQVDAMIRRKPGARDLQPIDQRAAAPELASLHGQARRIVSGRIHIGVDFELTREPAGVAQILGVHLGDHVRRLERAARRAGGLDRPGSLGQQPIERRCLDRPLRFDRVAQLPVERGSCATERESRIADLPRLAVALNGCSRTYRLVAERTAQIRECEPEVRPLVQASAFRLRVHVDSPREFLVQLDRIDVVCVCGEFPGARLRELELCTARHGAVESFDVVLGNRELLFGEHAARRALHWRKIRAVDLRRRREVIRQRTAQCAFTRCAHHSRGTAQGPLHVFPLRCDVQRRRIAVECHRALRVDLRRTLVERKVSRGDGQHALRKVAGRFDGQILAVQLGNADVTGDADAIRIGLHVQRYVAKRQRRLLHPGVERERRGIDVTGDVPTLVRARQHRRGRRSLRLMELCCELQPIEIAFDLAVERQHDRVARLQMAARGCFHAERLAGAQRDAAFRVELPGIDATIDASVAHAECSCGDRRASLHVIRVDHHAVGVLVAHVGQVDVVRIDAQELRYEAWRPRARRHDGIAQRHRGVTSG
jgi:hypothetical protein